MPRRLAAPALTTIVAAVCAFGVAAQEKSPIEATLFDVTGQPGNVVRLEVSCTCEGSRATATVFGRDVPLLRDGSRWRGLIGIDLNVTAGKYPIALSVESDGTPALATTRDLVVVNRQFRVRRLSVAPAFVDPPKNVIERIARESATLQALFQGALTPRQWQGGFLPPVREPANSSFGSRSVFNGQSRNPHSGADFGARTGTPVAAPAAAVVALAAPLYFTGNTVVLDHGLGLYSLLAHLSDFTVKEGDVIQRGHVVGTVGATGRVTGPHLHWGVQLNGARVDPLSLIAVTKDYEALPAR
jgi:hypothetical protein